MTTQDSKTPALGMGMAAMLMAGLGAVGGWMFSRKYERREERARRFQYSAAVFDGFILHLQAVHAGRFGLAQDALAYTECAADDVMQHLPGRKLNLYPPAGVERCADGSWLLTDDKDRQAAYDHLTRLAESCAPETPERKSERDLLLKLVDLLVQHAGERGHTEDEVETLQRIIRERDEALQDPKP
jgi:hypothetical protein